MPDITYTVFRRSGRRYYQCEWIDPVTGRTCSESTKETNEKSAKIKAAEIIARVKAGEYQRSNMEWSVFCERFETEMLPPDRVSDGTASKFQTIFKAIDTIIAPRFLRALDSTQIARLLREWRAQGLSEATIKGYCGYLSSCLNWAKRQEFISKVPVIEMPKRTAGMKGRPITTEEFERMLAAVDSALETNPRKPPTEPEEIAAAVDLARRVADSWKHLLRGLWWSGLRLGEALNLHWTDRRLLCVDLSGRRPLLRIQARGQKRNRYDETPIAPEFEDFLRETPEQDRRGYVFNALAKRDGLPIRRVDTASDVIVLIGEKACVKVSEKPARRKSKDGKPAPEKVKYASAHDLRRTFGFRWAQLVMPPILQQLMRHESISTTMEFYVGRNAEAASDAMHAALEAKRKSSTDTFTDSSPDPRSVSKEENPQPLSESRVSESHRSDLN